MTARRKAATVASLAMGPLALTGLAAGPAAAHGSMTDPVSRVSACYAEGPESPRSAACKAAVAASGTQAFYDWNAVNIANAAGRSKQIIPDGKLCSAGNDKYKGLDLARADWPSTKLTAGRHTFRYKGTAPHKGTFELYVTEDGYDPAKPLKWSDLESAPFAKVTNPSMRNGDYVFDATLPAKSGRHLVYSIWQRSDSPEAFYTCSDVVFGKDSGGAGSAPAPTASAPTRQQVEDGAAKSTVEHHGHGDDDANTGAGAPARPAADKAGDKGAAKEQSANQPHTDSVAAAPAQEGARTENLAETGGSGSTPYLAFGGAAALAAGAAFLFLTVRRKAAPAGGRHGR
ncbi:lytic polysaccharide monooxygenase [Streptomyces sp. TLI_146]|uniref:lytic polysaccharide monooxygenase auxiliary activity family 9 protein n=1 Tax=Streptomyces sp. TLI_146 TaxID=1938858 RepID=UPI000C7044FD|nr:lytic polysaccharide monooxygenase [Streptomyces sp. TLI_146]PKV84884.1 chitin-binding protein [Streptomyces sp. TLI_146]